MLVSGKCKLAFYLFLITDRKPKASNDLLMLSIIIMLKAGNSYYMYYVIS